MTTAFLLLPVAAVLAWIYRQALPRGEGWSLFDVAVFGIVGMLVSAWVVWTTQAEFQGGGPVYDELVSAAGGYPIMVAGLAAGLTWRRLGARRGAGG
jgi:hypothetical protein